MSDMAYIMETQDPSELWLIDGESKFKVSRDMYWLLVSQGADLPPLHDISDLLAENAALRQQLADVTESMSRVEERCAKLRELVQDMWNDMSVCYEQYVRISSSDMRFYGDRLRELGIEVSE